MTRPSAPHDAVDERGRHGAARGGRRSLDVRVVLVGLPLLVALPLLAYGAFLLYVSAQEAADHARREQAAAQGALEAALTAELHQLQQTVAILTESAASRGGALDVTRAAALADGVVRAGLGIRSLAVLDRAGRVLVEHPPPAAPRPKVVLAPHHVRVFDTGAPAVSDLHESPVDGRLGISIDVPVQRGGRVAWIVSAQLDPAHLTRTLSALVGARDALSTVLDSSRRIVARTRELDRYHGELPSAETLQALDSGDRGWRRFRTRDGNVFLWTWSTIATGWTVWLGSPAREFDDALRTSMLRLAAVGVGVLLLAMAGTALLARRIAGSADRMAANAVRLTEGEHPPFRSSGIRQLDALYHALEAASDDVSRALADRDRALEAERAARAVADEHNRSKDLFLGMLSHELRNPLAPIRNSVFVLRHAEPGSAHARRAGAVIERQAEHLTRLVDDLLDVTRIARGKIELRRARVDLGEVVSRAADDFRVVMDDRGVAFRVELPAGPAWADGDPTRITQIVGNLLHNASKFTRPGDSVVLSLTAEGREAEIRVRDTGAGIEPALLPTIFDPFVQGERTLARTDGGLGLGLALVKAIAELHGGTVRAESAGKGRGAEFVVRLPLAEGAQAHPPPAPGAEGAKDRRRVLVVDDNRDAADSLADLVRLLGHEVAVVYDGRAAIETARALRPHVVLCDLGLPGVDGFDVAKALRAEATEGMRIVAVSGYAQPEDVARAAAAGFDAHVAKPPEVSLLERLLS